jgi:hypothetical protein
VIAAGADKLALTLRLRAAFSAGAVRSANSTNGSSNSSSSNTSNQQQQVQPVEVGVGSAELMYFRYLKLNY